MQQLDRSDWCLLHHRCVAPCAWLEAHFRVHSSQQSHGRCQPQAQLMWRKGWVLKLNSGGGDGGGGGSVKDASSWKFVDGRMDSMDTCLDSAFWAEPGTCTTPSSLPTWICREPESPFNHWSLRSCSPCQGRKGPRRTMRPRNGTRVRLQSSIWSSQLATWQA